MSLPLEPPVKPQLAKGAKDLPEGEGWRYEPKWDGFRTLVFRDGPDIHLQSRNGRPMNRYFPDVVAQVEAYDAPPVVLDGEIVVEVDGVQEFDLLSQRIHPAASRVERLAAETPAWFVAFDLLAEGSEGLLGLPYDERRARLAAVVADPIRLTPMTADLGAARTFLTGHSEGAIAKEGDAPYRPGERSGMLKIKRVRTIDCVVVAFRFGKDEGTVGSLILGLHDDEGELRVVGHTSGFTARQKRELLAMLEPYRTGERGSGGPSRWKSDEDLQWEGLRPELVCEVAFDHITGNRIRHGAKLQRWRDDKDPRDCRLSDLRTA
ncbi:MAG TPA: ATP-dependent DNA ligase [Thermoleophilaceae bacterium]|nr:ATP-dependent DNA ligase [Thermoleophilaceae bacterium]